MKLEEKLVQLRTEKGLTQLELAEAMDVSRQAVSRWEVGTSTPTTENLACLGRLYGVSVDYLLNDRAEEPVVNSPKKELSPADTGKAGRRWMAAALAALSLAVLILAICVGALLLSQREDAHNLSDLIGEEGVIPDSTFSLEWP